MESEPMSPDPPSPAQYRARRATHLAVKRIYQERGALAWSVPQPAEGPACCAFHEYEVLCCVVIQTDAAREMILMSSHPGRLFPQALGEAFGTIDPDLVIALEVITHDGHPSDIVRITVRHQGQTRHTFHLSLPHLAHISPLTRLPNFNPIETAKELVRLYQMHHPQE